MTSFHSTSPALRQFLANHPRLAVITGAGVSAASGIPTYRDRGGVWQHSAPITHQEFVEDPACRRRYWARSLHGWPAVRDARPNAAHRALAQLEHRGHIDLLITQNVDRLHQRAGSARVVDLHGRLDQVRCLSCPAVFGREHVQQQLLRDNPDSLVAPRQRRPDGDADVTDERVLHFTTPHCEQCQGTLIPDVVFFGGSVPSDRVQVCVDAVTGADALLAVGSSLQVYSGFRFCRLAARLGKPIAILNPGATRADSLADIKLVSECAPLLSAMVADACQAPDIRPSENIDPAA